MKNFIQDLRPEGSRVKTVMTRKNLAIFLPAPVLKM
jgi:hypothetical protein